MTRYPTIVAQLVNCFDAWVVGSAASKENPRDYDLVIDPANWSKAAQIIPKDAKVNSFGGWKFTSSGIEVDVWPETLNNLLTNYHCTEAYHPRSGTFIKMKRKPQ